MDLAHFAIEFLKEDFLRMTPREFYDFGDVKSQILYRGEEYQAELFMMLPGQGFPREHRHPDVDGFEYILSAGFPFLVNGHKAETYFSFLPKPIYWARSSDWHGVGAVPAGGTFLSLQRWKNGVTPSSVGLNWEGTPIGLTHKKILTNHPSAKWVKTVRKS